MLGGKPAKTRTCATSLAVSRLRGSACSQQHPGLVNTELRRVLADFLHKSSSTATDPVFFDLRAPHCRRALLANCRLYRPMRLRDPQCSRVSTWGQPHHPSRSSAEAEIGALAFEPAGTCAALPTPDAAGFGRPAVLPGSLQPCACTLRQVSFLWTVPPPSPSEIFHLAHNPPSPFLPVTSALSINKCL